jgi:hypothetical protein
VPAPVVKRPTGETSGKYSLLYKYLENRYATTVVLTFGQIEDLLGFALPATARTSPEWWTTGDVTGKPPYSDAWVRAGRTASPNLPAQTVHFERTLVLR